MGQKSRQKRLAREGSPSSLQPQKKGSGTMVTLHRSEPVKSSALAIPVAERDRIARAVHMAADMVDSRGGGRCVYHTYAAVVILKAVHNIEAHAQCGSLALSPDPGDPGLIFEINGEDLANCWRGEFHAWVATRDGALIDLSARDYPAMVEGIVGHPMTPDEVLSVGGKLSAFGAAEAVDISGTKYRRPQLDYIWGAWNALPDFVHFRASQAATLWLRDEFWKDSQAGDFLKQAVRIYRSLP